MLEKRQLRNQVRRTHKARLVAGGARGTRGNFTGGRQRD